MRVKCPRCKADLTTIDAYYCKCGENVAKQKLIQYLIGDENGSRKKSKDTRNAAQKR